MTPAMMKIMAEAAFDCSRKAETSELAQIIAIAATERYGTAEAMGMGSDQPTIPMQEAIMAALCISQHWSGKPMKEKRP